MFIDTLSEDPLPAAAIMYTRITDMISAIFSTELICSGDCQKTMTALINFMTSLFAEAFEASLTESASSATIPLELYETEQEQMAEYMPRSGHLARPPPARRPPAACPPPARPPAGTCCRCATTPRCLAVRSCMCSIKFGDILAGAAGSAESFVGMMETLAKEEEGVTEPTYAEIIASLKLFLKDLVGKDSGFMSSNGLCTGDCRSMMAWMVKFDLTMLTSIPYQALVDEVGDTTAVRRLARIGGRALGQVEAALPFLPASLPPSLPPSLPCSLTLSASPSLLNISRPPSLTHSLPPSLTHSLDSLYSPERSCPRRTRVARRAISWHPSLSS